MYKPLVLALLASLVWGIAPIFFKLGLKEGLLPVHALVIHNLIAFLSSLIVSLKYLHQWQFTVKGFLLVAFGGFLSGFLGLHFFYKALKTGDVSLVSPVASTSPLWASIFALTLLQEEINLLKLVGIVLVVCGIALLSYAQR
ncbi:EamA family transporter [Thermocrinis minervae]|uniref:Transporter family protein n=1 Tax=Thermocrinis minervae TaxID=381751 RepID=A0A1M6SY51_9AQUI|nr:EamA family transporter [Thermocrinis minervae]SHK49651.1 transporter family protein [Thermocrinis minervae]